jgi:hypothetical protein
MAPDVGGPGVRMRSSFAEAQLRSVDTPATALLTTCESSPAAAVFFLIMEFLS